MPSRVAGVPPVRSTSRRAGTARASNTQPPCRGRLALAYRGHPPRSTGILPVHPVSRPPRRSTGILPVHPASWASPPRIKHPTSCRTRRGPVHFLRTPAAILTPHHAPLTHNPKTVPDPFNSPQPLSRAPRQPNAPERSNRSNRSDRSEGYDRSDSPSANRPSRSLLPVPQPPRPRDPRPPTGSGTFFTNTHHNPHPSPRPRHPDPKKCTGPL